MDRSSSVRSRRRLLVLTISTLSVAACGITSPAPSGPPGSGSPSAVSPSALPPSGSPTVRLPQKDHDVPALEALFPRRILGLEVATRSYTLATLPEGFPLPLQTVGRFFGKSAREVGVGLAAVPGNIVELVSVQVQGAAPDRLVDAFFIALGIPQVTPAETIAGKQVHAVRSADAIVGYLYPKGDVIFWVTAQRQRFAEDAIRQLP